MPVSRPSCTLCFCSMRFKALREEDRRAQRFEMLHCVLPVALLLVSWKKKKKERKTQPLVAAQSCSSLLEGGEVKQAVSQRGFLLRWDWNQWETWNFSCRQDSLQSWTKFPALPSPLRKGSSLVSYRELCEVDGGDNSQMHQTVKVGEAHWEIPV